MPSYATPKKRLEYLASARRDLRRIAEYYLDTAGVTVTTEIAREIDQAVGLISDSPEIGRKLENSPYRQLVVGRYPFIILYRLTPASVKIIRVLHQAQRRPK